MFSVSEVGELTLTMFRNIIKELLSKRALMVFKTNVLERLVLHYVAISVKSVKKKYPVGSSEPVEENKYYRVLTIVHIRVQAEP